MRFTRFVAVVLIATFALAAGCAGKKKRDRKKDNAATGSETKKGPTPMTAEEKQTQAKAMAVMKKVGEAATKHKDDCDALATAWETLWNDNKALIDAAIKIDRDPKKVAQWDKAYGKEKKEIQEQMRVALEKCEKHKRIVGLLAKMKQKPMKPKAKQP